MENMAEIVRRLEDVERRLSEVEEGVQRAVKSTMPKLDALLSAQGLAEQTSGTDTSAAADVTSDTAHGNTDMVTYRAGNGASNALAVAASSTALGALRDVPVADATSSAVSLLESGDVEGLARLLAAGSDIQQRDRCGNTALHLAAIYGNLTAACVLLSFGASVGTPGQRLRTPLHCAAAHGHLTVAGRLLGAGALVGAEDVDGRTPLALAVDGGHEEMAVLLLKQGARLGTVCEQVKTSVFQAASRGQMEFLRLALDGGFPVDECDDMGDTVLQRAVREQQWGVVRLLLERGADGTKCEAAQQSALELASRAGQTEVVRELLRRGAASQKVQLNSALERAKGDVLMVFIEAVPDAIRGQPGMSALYGAAAEGRLLDMETLVRAGVKSQHPDYVLVAACRGGHLDCVVALLDWGADVNCKTCGGSPLSAASEEGHMDVIRELLRRGAVDPYAFSCAKNSAVVWELAKSTPEVLRGNKAGEVLTDSAICGRHEAMVALLEAGIPINATSVFCRTALHYAARDGHIVCVTELLQRGAHVDAKDDYGYTPLHLASSECHLDIVRVLLAAGASTIALSKEGKRAVDLATSEAVRHLFDVTS